MNLKPWLLLPASAAHALSTPALKVLNLFLPTKKALWRPVHWQGLDFCNPLGIAGGVDKNAEQMAPWWKLGCGFIEIGTITPLPQKPNPGLIIDRNFEQKALWNKMGFPSKGVDFAIKQLKKLPKKRPTPIFANIGKNRTTPNAEAHKDYLTCIQKLTPYVDAFVINISSPNTQGLRDLLLPENIKKFLLPISQQKTKPTLLKISPDLSYDELTTVLKVSLELGFDGWVLTNTTVKRPFIGFLTEGGLSGKPLSELSKSVLKQTLEILGPKRENKLLISAGGVMNYEDVKERLNLGADLIQVYSALVFSGPFFFRQISEQAKKDDL